MNKTTWNSLSFDTVNAESVRVFINSLSRENFAVFLKVKTN